MSNPPRDIPSSELWRRLSERPRPSKRFKLPCKPQNPGDEPFEFEVILWVLTESEMHTVRANAERTAKAILPDTRSGDLGYEEIYQNELIIELVCIACRATENPVFPAFRSAKEARSKLTTDEFGCLAAAYGMFRAESGPMLSELTPEDMEAWLKVLSDGASRIPLARLSGAALQDLVMCLVQKLNSSRTGSVGSPQDDASPALSNEMTDPASLISDEERAP